MTWIIDGGSDPPIERGIVLPYGVSEVRRRVLRKDTAESVMQDFGLPFDLGPESFELHIRGLITPASEANKLWEIAKRPDRAAVTITVIDEPEFEMYSGYYLINRADIGLSRPMYDAETGKVVQEFDLAFINPSAEGTVGFADSEEVKLDEPGVGFGDIAQQLSDFLFETISPNLYNKLMA